MPLHLSPLREVGLLAAGVACLGLAVWFDRRKRGPVSVSTLRNPSAASRNPLDAFAWNEVNDRTAGLADAGLYGAPTLSLLLALHPRPRPEYPKLLLIWLETMLLNFAVTSAIKNRVSRPRPYVLHDAFPYERSLSRNDRAAFLSGHASMAAAGSMLFARLLHHYFPEDDVRYLGWFLAGAFPAFTAYLRVKSAKHWPTDAVAGVLLGGMIGYLVPGPHLK